MSPDELAQGLAKLQATVEALRAEVRQALGTELLTIGQVSKLLKTSEGAVRQAIRRGTIKCVHVPPGNRVRIRRQDLGL